MNVYLDGQLSKNFKYKDLINPLGKSVEKRVQLEPLFYQIKNARFVLEPVELFLDFYPGWSVKITSFFRSEPENKRVGGSSSSSHKEALAVDFEVFNPQGQERNKTFIKFIHDRKIPFDQIIFFNSRINPTAIHLGRGPKMRNEYLLYTKQAGYNRILYPY